MNNTGDRGQADASSDREREFRDHLTRMSGDHSGADNLISAFTYQDFEKTFSLTVEYRPIHLSKRLDQSPHPDAAPPRLIFV